MHGFNMLDPVEITDAVLTATNAEEDAADWDDETDWDLGEIANHGGRLWEAAQANTGHEPPLGTDGDEYWIDTGPNNIRAMFDGAIQSQTVADDEIVVELTPPIGARPDTLFGQNVNAVSATVSVTDPASDFEYTATQRLQDNSGVVDIGTYLFLPLRRRTYFLFDKLPNFGALKYALTLSAPDSEARCGDCVLGRAYRLGTTQLGGEIGVRDFSVKKRDDFGRMSWVERAFASTGSFALNVAPGDTDLVVSLLTAARASRRVYIAFAGHGCTIINGVVTDWRGVLSTPTRRVFNCSFESLA